MQRGQRSLSLASRLAVMVWVAGALAWTAVRPDARDEADAAEAPELTARVQPRPEPAPQAAEEPSEPLRAEAPPPPEPDSEPASSPPPAPRTTRVGAAEIEAGNLLLGTGGNFPALSLGYAELGSFREYARAMRELGARFVVVRQREIAAEIDLETGALRETRVDARFSPRARDYTGEPALAHLARSARERFGRDAVVMLLVPRELDAGLFGGISRALARDGESHGAYTEIRGHYRRAAAGGLELRIDAATRRDGQRVDLDLLFDLSALAAPVGGSPRA